MKVFKKFYLTTVLLLLNITAFSAPRSGFYIPDSLQEVSLTYKVINNLIILPVTINDSITLNLVLDTGCRNLVLFGKRFQNFFTTEPNQHVKFSGLGAGSPVLGKLSLNNKVSIAAVIGEKIPVVIVPHQGLFKSMGDIHGVIGYDIFLKFEVEIIPERHVITFRPAASAHLSASYTSVPIRVEDSRPLIDCRVVFTKNKTRLCDLMIDTGSALGLLLKTTDIDHYDIPGSDVQLGRGFNGPIRGIETITEKLVVGDLKIENLLTGIIQSPWHNYASIGMDVLKDYSLVLNYCKGYAGFRKIST